MIKNKYERALHKILVFCIIFNYLFGGYIVLAVDNELRDNIGNQVESWLNGTNVNDPIKYYEYEKDNTKRDIYVLHMPEPDPDPKKSPNIMYDPETKGYIYILKDGNGNITGKVPINIEIVCVPISEAPGEITTENYKKFLDTGPSGIYETKQGEVKVLGLDSEEHVYFAYAVSIDGGPVNIYEGGKSVGPKKQDKPLIEILGDFVEDILSLPLDFVKNQLVKVFNTLFLAIGDGIQSLINALMGEDESVTVYKVIFNKIGKLEIDFWGIGDEAEGDKVENEEEKGKIQIISESPATSLKPIVSYWYSTLRALGVAIYIVMLLYIGVRILLSSTTSSAQKYKEMLTTWGTGVIILLLFPYVMKYTVIINDAFVKLLDSSAASKLEEMQMTGEIDEEYIGKPGEGKNLFSFDDEMMKIREQAADENDMVLSIVYIIMLGQLIILIGVYYKRTFMMAFLITIFPVVAVLYVWEKTNKGAGNALNTWTKEYVVLVLTQTFHAMSYTVLVKGAYEAFLDGGNWFIFILSVVFLFQGEKIIRAIFGMKSSANTIGDLASAGATAWMATKSASAIFKSDKTKTDKDDKDEAEANEQIENAKKQTAINNALNNRYPNSNQTTSTGNSSAPSRGNGTYTPSISDNQMENLEAARAYIRQQALAERNRKKGKGILQKGVRGITKTAGVTLGAATGLAGGSAKQAAANALIGKEIGGMFGNGVSGIIGFAKNAYRGQRLKMKVRSGEMDNQLRALGFDFGGRFDDDPDLSSAKARIIREALAAEITGTRRGGKSKGEYKFIKAVEKGIKRENIK
mgnify:CR=1 FL=1